MITREQFEAHVRAEAEAIYTPLMEAKDKRNQAAVALGALGGKARAKNLSATKRKAIAKKAAKSRWEGRASK